MIDLVEEMYACTQKDVAVFQKFLLDYENYNNTLFYFVEGKDFCYYNPRIIKHTNGYDLMHYVCGGKQQVIGVYELIKNKIKCIDENKILYFIDKDFGFNINMLPCDIYITDFYSIENFYLSKNIVKRILTEFLEIDIHTHNFKVAMEYFDKCYNEYSIFGKKINSFFYTIRFFEIKNKLKRTDFKVKLTKFLLNNSLSEYKFKEYDFNDFMLEYKLKFEIDESEYAKNLMLFSEEDHSNFRGKFEVEFLKNFLTLVKESIILGTDGFEKEEFCKVDFNNETMKLFSEYAYTPESLIDYLTKYSDI